MHFSRAERAGTIALMVICGLVYLAPEIMHRFSPKRTTDFTDFNTDVQNFRARIKSNNNDTRGEQAGIMFTFDPNTVTKEALMQLGLSEKVAGIIDNYRNKGGHFRQPEDLQKIYSLSAADFERLRPWIRMGGRDEQASEETDRPKIAAELFPFDPNTADEADLQRLGLSARTIKGIVNYRTKGGKFRKPEDFAKIYSLSEADFERLLPYIQLAATPERPVAYAGGLKFPEKKLVAKGSLDINRAGPEDWLQLPGIGEKRARQIVKYRETLGGFRNIEQLAEMYGLPDSVFQNIRAMLTLAPGGITSININTATVEELDRHPYVSFKQATLIVNYRSQHGSFATVDDLAKIIAFSDKSWLEKIKAYLTVQ